MEKRRYFGGWDSYESMKESWEDGVWDYDNRCRKATSLPEDFPKDEQVLFACYDLPSYEGHGQVIFHRGEKLFENTGSHCSCYGLEGQWNPEETTVEALAMRDYKDEFRDTDDDGGEAARAAWKSMVAELA